MYTLLIPLPSHLLAFPHSVAVAVQFSILFRPSMSRCHDKQRMSVTVPLFQHSRDDSPMVITLLCIQGGMVTHHTSMDAVDPENCVES